MENITNFVKFCEAYGVPKTGTFQTVDLFEGRNMAQVLNCIQQLGTEVHDDVIDNLPRPLNIYLSVVDAQWHYDFVVTLNAGVF